jgi:hypothetical protein
MRPPSKQSATEAIAKNIPTYIITKTKQTTIFIKNCFIYRLILIIVCTMVKLHQTNIHPPWVGVTLETQQICEVGELESLRKVCINFIDLEPVLHFTQDKIRELHKTSHHRTSTNNHQSSSEIKNKNKPMARKSLLERGLPICGLRPNHVCE